MVQPIDLAEGYYQVPAGKLVNAVTWLETRAPRRDDGVMPLRLLPVTEAEAEDCMRLFKAVGTPWLWSRAYDPPEDGDAMRPGDAHFALDGERRVGIVEFAGRGEPDIEITWFGLVPEATGRRFGRRMMAAALDLAWASGPTRVWLHTCNFDSPAAIRFYLACGFVPYETGFEVMDDPRLDGRLPRDAAPHVPLIAR